MEELNMAACEYKQCLQSLTFAALLHDIGIFAERAGYCSAEWQRLNHSNIASFCTARFIEEHLSEFEDFQLMKDYSFTQLATGCRAPKNALELIITEAELQATGHEQAEIETCRVNDTPEASSIHLYPIVERVALQRVDDNNVAKYIEKNNVESFFEPVSLEYPQRIFPKGNKSVCNCKSDYKKYFESFMNEFAGYAKILQRDEHPRYTGHINTFRMILQKYLWCIPHTDQYQKLPDVSIYDHSRLTSMLAACLYKYHFDEGSLNELDIRDAEKEKYLLVCGDISGIQKFIYNISSKGAYKSIKGRSFFMQILPMIIAHKVLKRIGMDESQVIYSSGGKFYLLLPNLPQLVADLTSDFEAINFDLYQRYGGLLFLRTGFAQFKPALLSNQKENEENLCTLWDRLTREMSVSDRKKYAGSAKQNYEKIFTPGREKEELCSICHMQFVVSEGKEEAGIRKCPLCLDFEGIGADIRSKQYLKMKEGPNFKYETLGYSFDFVDKLSKIEHASDVYFLKGFENITTILPGITSTGTNFYAMPVGGIHRFEDDFDEIANKSKGTKLLGILRMDVDNLGKIFADGLRFYQHGANYMRNDFLNDKQMDRFNFHSISRIATLSSQLAIFFSIILQDILESNEEWRRDAIIVYSGGDDLFVLGRWDVIPGIGLEINKKFRDFVCHNPAFSLSAGISLIPGKYPMYKGAELSGTAEDMAKQYQREGKKKNAIHFFGQSFDWDEFEALNKLVKEISTFENKAALIRRINLIAETHREAIESRKRKQMGMAIEDIRRIVQADKWRWRMIYSLSRFAQKDHTMKNIADDLVQYFIGTIPKTGRIGIEDASCLGRWLRHVNRDL